MSGSPVSIGDLRMKTLLCLCLTAVLSEHVLAVGSRGSRLEELKMRGSRGSEQPQTLVLSTTEAKAMVSQNFRYSLPIFARMHVRHYDAQASHMCYVFQIESRLRSRRASGQGSPIIHGNYSFDDNNIFAAVHYSGSSSPVSRDVSLCVCLRVQMNHRSIPFQVILILTYSQQQQQPTNVHIYRYVQLWAQDMGSGLN